MRAIFRFLGLLILVALILGGIAVWIASRWVDVDIVDGEAIATITMDEGDLNRVVRWSVVEGGPDVSLLDDITRIDLSDGKVRVEGAYTAPSGVRKLGWVDLVFAAEHGALVAEVKALDREGIPAEGAAIQAINARLREAMTVETGDKATRVTRVEVREDGVVLEARTRITTR